MATCYNCIHCGACSDAGDSGYSCLKEDVSECKHFKNKADVVEVKHGKWIDDGEYQICSICGEEHHWDEYRATYCEECGEKMDEK